MRHQTITERRLRRKLAALESKRKEIESNRLLSNHLFLIGSSQETIQKWRQEWQTYYQTCRNSIYAKISRELHKEYVINAGTNIDRITRLLDFLNEKKQTVPFTPEPKCPDPFAVDAVAFMLFNRRKEIDREITEINDLLSDYETDSTQYKNVF